MTALGDKAVQLAQSLIRCESVTPVDAGALDVLIQALKPGRFTFWRLNFKDEDTPPVDNLYARVGEGPPHLCFAGHVDVVPPGEAELWTHPPFAAEIAERLALRQGRRRHEGRNRLLHRRGARLRQIARPRDRRLDLACSSPAMKKGRRSTAPARCSPG